MANSNYNSYFGPESLGELQAVFDEAWDEISALPGRAVTATEADERRTDLAQMIILAHRSGIPPEKIKNIVLGRKTPNGLITAKK